MNKKEQYNNGTEKLSQEETVLSLFNTITYWLTDHIRYMGMYLFFACITLITTYLYDRSIMPVLYGFCISLFVGGIGAILSIYKYHGRYNALLRTMQQMEYSLDALPVPVTELEKQYTLLLQELYAGRIRLYSDMRKRETEETDYYTMWIHQIKTPIAAMRLLLQKKNISRDELSHHTILLEQELFHIEQYAEMALHYLHLQGDSSDLLLKKQDLYEIIRPVVKKYAISFIEKKLSLEFEEFHYDLVTDEKWMAFVVEQILSNCIKYTTAGTICIKYEPQENCLRITDTGIGIREDDIPRIFERGYTGYNGHMDKRSTGIGLYLCRQVLDQLGYRIEVSSKLGEGSTFLIFLQSYKNESLEEEM